MAGIARTSPGSWSTTAVGNAIHVLTRDTHEKDQ